MTLYVLKILDVSITNNMSIIYMSRRAGSVAQEIKRQGLEGVSRNLGTQLAGQYCNHLLWNIKGGTGKPVCGTPLLNQIISELPIYFIIAHSSVDIHLIEDSGNSKKKKPLVLAKSPPLFKQLPLSSNDILSNSKFLINTTTVGGWGLLDKETTCIPLDHILRENVRVVRDFLFRQDEPVEGRIGIYETHETMSGRTPEIGTTKYPALYNLPGTNYIDKVHQFGGDQELTGGGFGIIKVGKASESTSESVETGAFGAIKTWEERQKNKKGSNKEKSDPLFRDNVYFLTDEQGDIGGGIMTDSHGVTPKDIALWELIRGAWRKQNYENEDGTTSPMWASNVKISDIIETGGPGIYISLSCSELKWIMPEGRTKEEVGVREIYQAFRTVGGFNRKLWNNFCMRINMLIQFSRSAVAPSSASTLTGDGNQQGPYYNSKSKKGGKRKRTKRKKKRRKIKTRKRRKRKTRKRKTRKKKKRNRR